MTSTNCCHELGVQGSALADYRNALDTWYRTEGDLNSRPELDVAVLSGDELADITVADLATLSSNSLTALVYDENLFGAMSDVVRHALKEIQNEGLDAATEPIASRRETFRQNMVGWFERTRRRLAMVDETLGTPLEEGADPYAGAWIQDVVRRRAADYPAAPKSGPKPAPPKGAFVFSEGALDPSQPAAVELFHDTFVNLDAAITAAKANLRHIADERMQARAVSAERQRLSAKRATITDEVVWSGRKMAEVVSYLSEEAPVAVEGVIKTIENNRAAALDAGRSLSDPEVYYAYQRTVEEHGREHVRPELLLSFCIVHALMDGDPNGRFPANL